MTEFSLISDSALTKDTLNSILLQ